MVSQSFVDINSTCPASCMNYKTLKSNYCFIFCDKSNLYSPTRSVPALQPGAGRSVSRLWSKLPNAGCLCNCHWMLFKIQSQPKPKTLPKAQRTRELSSTYQSNFFGSYHKFKHKSWSNIFRISTLHQLQNLNQTSPFPENLNLKILTKPNQNLDQEWTS